MFFPSIGVYLVLKGELDFAKRLIRENLVEQVNAFEDTLTPSILFDDSITAQEIIKTISYNPLISGVALWKRNLEPEGNSESYALFASSENYSPKLDRIVGEKWSTKTVTITKMIGNQGNILGYFSLSRSLSDLNTRKDKFIGFGLLSWLVIIVVVIVTLCYQISLTRPIQELIQVAENISTYKDYSIRARQLSDDEFGRLIKIFNQMMDSLNSSDQKLREVNNDMENKVKLRTKELSSSNKKLIQEMEQREKAHNELSKMREKFNRQENLANVGQVSSNIAHELRNPMTAIRNSVYFLRKHFITDQKALNHLEVIDSQLSQSDEVIQRLLELTKGGKIKLKITDLRKIVHGAFYICSPPGNIQLKVNLENTTKEVRLDPLLFRQILTNLFSNSIQAMPQGGWISLSATQKESNIEIRVTDNGEGIPVESWNKVFDPLYTNKKDGIGLGLSICRELTERHNGSITIETSSQIGTTFLILLPAPSLILA